MRKAEGIDQLVTQIPDTRFERKSSLIGINKESVAAKGEGLVGWAQRRKEIMEGRHRFAVAAYHLENYLMDKAVDAEISFDEFSRIYNVSDLDEEMTSELKDVIEKQKKKVDKMGKKMHEYADSFWRGDVSDRISEKFRSENEALEREGMKGAPEMDEEDFYYTRQKIYYYVQDKIYRSESCSWDSFRKEEEGTKVADDEKEMQYFEQYFNYVVKLIRQKERQNQAMEEARAAFFEKEKSGKIYNDLENFVIPLFCRLTGGSEPNGKIQFFVKAGVAILVCSNDADYRMLEKYSNHTSSSHGVFFTKRLDGLPLILVNKELADKDEGDTRYTIRHELQHALHAAFFRESELSSVFDSEEKMSGEGGIKDEILAQMRGLPLVDELATGVEKVLYGYKNLFRRLEPHEKKVKDILRGIIQCLKKYRQVFYSDESRSILIYFLMKTPLKKMEKEIERVGNFIKDRNEMLSQWFGKANLANNDFSGRIYPERLNGVLASFGKVRQKVLDSFYSSKAVLNTSSSVKERQDILDDYTVAKEKTLKDLKRVAYASETRCPDTDSRRILLEIIDFCDRVNRDVVDNFFEDLVAGFNWKTTDLINQLNDNFSDAEVKIEDVKIRNIDEKNNKFSISIKYSVNGVSANAVIWLFTKAKLFDSEG